MQQANKRSIFRAVGIGSVLLATQLLSACVVVPAPYHQRYYGPGVVEVHPAPPPPPYDGRYWHR